MKWLWFFVLFLINICVASAESFAYFCEDKKGKKIYFSWDSEKVVVGRSAYYFKDSFLSSFMKDYKDPLKGHMDPNSYNVKQTDKKITLRLIQDTVLLRETSPKGPLLRGENNKLWQDFYKGVYPYIIRYHSIFPVVNQYEFDKEKKQLTLTYEYDFSPRKVTKITFSLSPKGKVQRKSEILSDKEAQKIYKERTKRRSWKYHQCKEKSAKRSFLHNLIDFFFPIW